MRGKLHVSMIELTRRLSISGALRSLLLANEKKLFVALIVLVGTTVEVKPYELIS